MFRAGTFSFATSAGGMRPQTAAPVCSLPTPYEFGSHVSQQPGSETAAAALRLPWGRFDLRFADNPCLALECGVRERRRCKIRSGPIVEMRGEVRDGEV